MISGVARIGWARSFIDAFFFFQAEDGIRDLTVTGVQTCALPISISDGQALRPLGRAEAVGADERRRPRARLAPRRHRDALAADRRNADARRGQRRSEEHTSELQSQSNLVCRLLLDKKKLMHTEVV